MLGGLWCCRVVCEVVGWFVMLLGFLGVEFGCCCSGIVRLGDWSTINNLPTTPHPTTPHHTTPRHTTPHRTILHHTSPHHTTPHHTTPPQLLAPSCATNAYCYNDNSCSGACISGKSTCSSSNFYCPFSVSCLPSTSSSCPNRFSSFPEGIEYKLREAVVITGTVVWGGLRCGVVAGCATNFLNHYQPPLPSITNHPTTTSHHQPPPATTSHHQPPSATTSHHQPQPATTSYQQPPPATTSHH